LERKTNHRNARIALTIIAASLIVAVGSARAATTAMEPKTRSAFDAPIALSSSPEVTTKAMTDGAADVGAASGEPTSEEQRTTTRRDEAAAIKEYRHQRFLEETWMATP
jgi:hypothetical protein